MSVVASPETRRAMGFRPSRAASLVAFWALLARDLRVLQKTIVVFAVRTIMQPLLLVFVFTYVFPKIGQGVGGSAASEASFSTLLMAGVVATSMIFQGVQAVALPLVQEFGYTREIEDRVMAPMPVWGVAVEKIAAGAVQALIAGLVVFPLAAVIPATPVHLHVHWLFLLTDRADRGGALRGARPDDGHPGEAPAGAAPVCHRGPADHVPRRGLLPLDVARADPLAAGPGARQSTGLHVRGLSPRAYQGGPAHADLGHLHGDDRLHRRADRGSASTAFAGACSARSSSTAFAGACSATSRSGSRRRSPHAPRGHRSEQVEQLGDAV